jgi:tellurite resistance protein
MDNSISKFAELFIQTGSVFAYADGNIDERERLFVANFIEALTKESLIEISDKEKLLTLKPDLDFATLITETNEFLLLCDKKEKETAITMLNVFIEELISSDGVIHENEEKMYNQWKKEFLKNK